MVTLRATPDTTTTMTNRVLEFLYDPLQHKRTMAALAFLAVSLLAFTSRNASHSRLYVRDDHSFGVKVSPRHRCFDAEDPKTLRPPKGQLCECTNPLVPVPWPKPGWDQHHTQLVDFAKKAAAAANLDIVMIGDSIIERWNGTRTVEQILADDGHLTVFEEYFTRHGTGGTLDGIALGTSGDTSNNLLWHLSHGFLDITELQPTVWFIMVGTNDLGRTGCSKRNALAGVLHVAQYLRDQRPGATIIVHGLLPRSDSKVEIPKLGLLWQQIVFINRELKKLCNLHEEWVYMDAASLFLKRVEGGTNRDLEINVDTMPDGLHPNERGYEIWSQEIVKKIDKFLTP